MTSGPGEQRVLLLGRVPRVEPAARLSPGEEGEQRAQIAPGQVGQQGWAAGAAHDAGCPNSFCRMELGGSSVVKFPSKNALTYAAELRAAIVFVCTV